MTLLTVAIDGRPIEADGFTPINTDAWLHAPQVDLGTADVIGRVGLTPSGRGMTTKGPPLQIGVYRDAGSGVATRAAMADFYARMQVGQHEIEFADAPGKVTYAYFQQATGVNLPLPLASTAMEIAGQFVRHDPLWYDRAPTPIGGTSNQRIVVPVGAKPSLWRILLAGPYATPVTWTVRNRSGDPVQTMVVNDAAADSSIYLLLDGSSESQSTTRFTNGVAASGESLIDAGSAFLVLDPNDGPTLENDKGDWTALIWRAYLL